MPITKRENIEKKSITYNITKFFVDLYFKLFFPKKVVGIKKINFDDILIFAPNHQNALMDALAILTMRVWKPVFLARADIFKKPLIEKILTFLRIMPVFRIRDGYENLMQNDKIFRKTIDVLNNRNGLVILPEGSHEGFRRLRQLKKGIARIAFQAINDTKGQINIKIVPVGLEYSHYYKFGSKMLLRLGEPINVLDYYPKYLKNNAKAINELIAELYIRIKKEMIHIKSEEYYAEYELLRLQGALETVIANKQKPNLNNLFDPSRQIINQLDELYETDNEGFNKIISEIQDFQKNLSLAGIEAPVHPSKMKGLCLFANIPVLIASLPLFIYGFINNMLPVGIIMLTSSKIKDPQFISSVRYVLGFVLFPLFYVIQTVIFAILVKNLWWALVYFATLPFFALFMIVIRKLFFNTVIQLKILKIKLFDIILFRKIKENIDFIKDFVIRN